MQWVALNKVFLEFIDHISPVSKRHIREPGNKAMIICVLRTRSRLVYMVLICVGCQLHHSADDPELSVHCDLPEGGVLLPC